LEKQQRYTLSKTERLKSRKVIEYLFKEGKAFSVFPLRVFYTTIFPVSFITANKLQAGFSVSTKNFKKAVDRNRIKRLMREAYRLQKNVLTTQLENSNKKIAFFFIYTGSELPDYKIIYEKIGSSIQRLQKILNEDAVTNI
jgi:ribonuclease P protein component